MTLVTIWALIRHTHCGAELKAKASRRGLWPPSGATTADTSESACAEVMNRVLKAVQPAKRGHWDGGAAHWLVWMPPLPACATLAAGATPFMVPNHACGA